MSWSELTVHGPRVPRQLRDARGCGCGGFRQVYRRPAFRGHQVLHFSAAKASGHCWSTPLGFQERQPLQQ